MTPDLDAVSADADTDGFQARSMEAERGGVDVTATDRPEAPPEPLPHDHGPDLDDHHQPTSGHLHAAGRDEFLYPEWDSVAGRYLPDWCLLRVRRPRTVRADRTHRRALARHGHLLPGLVAQLERVRPAGRDVVLRMPYGDDLDLDACIDAMVDLRVGIEPSDRVFASVQERRRDVAVAIGIDLSSSTAERLPPDPGNPKEVNRILDLERDAVSLLTEALERIGDAYGIYGFSGGGRDDVRLSVVKDLDERRSPALTHRLAGLTPDHTTRMGPAITASHPSTGSQRGGDEDHAGRLRRAAVRPRLRPAVRRRRGARLRARRHGASLGRSPRHRRSALPHHGRSGRWRLPRAGCATRASITSSATHGIYRRRWPSCTWSPAPKHGRPRVGQWPCER